MLSATAEANSAPRKCGAKTEGKKRQWGALLFGYFLLSKQK